MRYLLYIPNGTKISYNTGDKLESDLDELIGIDKDWDDVNDFIAWILEDIGCPSVFYNRNNLPTNKLYATDFEVVEYEEN